MSFVGVSAGIGAASLGLGVFKSISESNKANQIEKNNPRPTYEIPEEYRQNYRLAQQMAQIGLPQEQYNNQLRGINQNQSGAIAALSRSANPGANLASIVRGGDAALGNLNAQDATARMQNQRYAIQQNSALANQELAKQQYDKFDRYSENFNQMQADRAAANSNLNNAINGASQLAGGLAMNNSRLTGYPADKTMYAGDGSMQYGPFSGGYGFGAPGSTPYMYNTNYTNF